MVIHGVKASAWASRLPLFVNYPGTFEPVDALLLRKPLERSLASEEFASKAEIYTPEIEIFKQKLSRLKHKLSSYRLKLAAQKL
jgi:hypothetical protein